MKVAPTEFSCTFDTSETRNSCWENTLIGVCSQPCKLHMNSNFTTVHVQKRSEQKIFKTEWESSKKVKKLCESVEGRGGGAKLSPASTMEEWITRVASWMIQILCSISAKWLWVFAKNWQIDVELLFCSIYCPLHGNKSLLASARKIGSLKPWKTENSKRKDANNNSTLVLPQLWFFKIYLLLLPDEICHCWTRTKKGSDSYSIFQFFCVLPLTVKIGCWSRDEKSKPEARILFIQSQNQSLLALHQKN